VVTEVMVMVDERLTLPLVTIAYVDHDDIDD
jgi:hypothetical protein